MNKFQYNTKSYNGYLAMLSILIGYFGTFIVLISLFVWVYMPPKGISLLIISFVFLSPLIFKKKIKVIFTRKVLLEMDKDSFSVSYLNPYDESIKKQKVYLWNSINSFDFSFGENTPSITALTLHFKKGLPKTFNFFDKEFKDDKSFREMLQGECILTLFYNHVKQYNIGKSEEDQIQLVPGFFATKTGKIIIYLLAVLIVSAIVLHLIIAPKSSFATILISIGLVAGFFSKRKSSLELYKKIKELD